MSDWTQGYVADIDYTHGYYRELNPAQFGPLLANRGFAAPDLAQPFSYCELGYGQGFGLALLAAMYPHGNFWGTDFNPLHTRHAEGLASRAGLGNMHVSDQSFAEFAARTDLPQFDYIVLHGIWSWVTDENRAIIRDFLGQRLKRGGVAYVSYNCLPGWSMMAPLRALMHQIAPPGTGSSVERVDRAFGFLETLRDQAKAGYFAVNAAAGDRLAKFKGQPKNYLAHELFNTEWTLFYHHQVAAAMAEAKLDYVGQAQMIDQIDIVNLTEDQRQFLAGISDSRLRETTRDFITNQQFRREIYVKAPLPLPARSRLAQIENCRFELIVDPAGVEMKQRFLVGEGTLQEAVYRPIIERLAQGPASAAELTALPALQATGLAGVWQACLVLMGTGKAEPVPPPPVTGASRADSIRRLNRVVIEEARDLERLRFLAASSCAATVGVNRLQLLLLLAQLEGHADPALFAWETLAGQGQKLVKDGKPIEDPAENLAQIRRDQAEFERRILPVYRRLGVI